MGPGVISMQRTLGGTQILEKSPGKFSGDRGPFGCELAG
jgi:hypothetical protein